MATNESIIELRAKWKSEAEQGIKKTSSALKDLGLVGKNVGEVLGGSTGAAVEKFGRFGKDLGELSAKFPALAVAAVGVGVAIGGAALATKLFFNEALHQSPELAANFELLKERISAVVSWIADKLTPAFNYFISLALKFLPDLTDEMGNNTEATRKNAKGISEWKDAHIKAFASIATLQATQSRVVGNEYAYQLKLLKIKNKEEIDSLTNKQSAERALQIKGTKEYANLYAKQTEELKGLKANQDAELLKLTQDHSEEERALTESLTNELWKSSIDLRKEGKLKELDQLELEQSKELSNLKLSEEQKNIILETYANKRKAIDKKASEFTKQQGMSTLQSYGALSAGLAQLYVSGNKVTREERLKYKALMMATAAINTATGITGALGTPPYGPWAIAQAAAIGALGAVQIAAISQQTFEKGGIIGGRRHSQGGTLIEAELGESILTRDATRRIGADGVNALNNGGSLGGGSVTIHAGDIIIQGHADYDVIAKALNSRDQRVLDGITNALRSINTRGIKAK